MIVKFRPSMPTNSVDVPTDVPEVVEDALVVVLLALEVDVAFEVVDDFVVVARVVVVLLVETKH